MGCCSTRDVTLTQRDSMPGEDLERIMREYDRKHPTVTIEVSESNEGSISTEADMARDIERYVKELVRKGSWTIEHESEDFELKSLAESKFAPEIRVAYMRVKFSQKATVEGVYRALEVPHIRMKWDTSVIEMKETPPIGHNTRILYTAINHAIFGRPKDFVEKKVVKKSYKQTKVIFHSSESMVTRIQSFPQVQGRDRGHTFMLEYLISAKDGDVTLEIVRQTDYKLPWVMNLFGVLGKTYVLAWLGQLKAAVESGV